MQSLLPSLGGAVPLSSALQQFSEHKKKNVLRVCISVLFAFACTFPLFCLPVPLSWVTTGTSYKAVTVAFVKYSKRRIR
ncbi:hypothetical protein CHARACLAT_009344 [Characodon lateralis]|uniref:Uncharacterized protein n=1 Tax=Characodon lateralis TaxID=208331 RepID=A0ABU7EA60_9TELE|nr:hypothetical protein [Characodon lateralis]